MDCDNNEVLRELRKIIYSIYKQKINDFKKILKRIDKNLIPIYEKESNIRIIISESIKWANLNHKLRKLIKKICEKYPNLQDLKKFKQEHFPDLSDGVRNKNSLSASLSNEWQDLLQILKEIDNLDLITNICCRTLEDNYVEVSLHYPALALNQTVENLDIIEEILIDKHPKNKNSDPTILEFARRLRFEDGVKRSQKNKIDDWVKSVKQKLSITTEIYKPPQKSFKSVESYLMIIVEKSQTNTEKLYLKAELVADNLPDNQIIEYNNQSHIECTLNQLAINIYNFIGIAKIKHPNSVNYDLSIEVFLPSDLLNEDIDLQNIPISDKDKKREKPIGNEYKFIVRSLDTLRECHNKYLDILSDKWKKLQNINESEIKKFFYNLTQIDNLDYGTIEGEFEDKLGMKITCYLPNNLNKQDIGDIYFYTIVRGGIPIAIWLRSNNIANVNINHELDKILEQSHLKDLQTLFKNIQEIRKEAHSKENNAKNYLGYHLGFLCDNPDRIPSCFPEEAGLIPTGG